MWAMRESTRLRLKGVLYCLYSGYSKTQDIMEGYVLQCYKQTTVSNNMQEIVETGF